MDELTISIICVTSFVLLVLTIKYSAMIENFIRGPLTTMIGLVILCGSVVGFYLGHVTPIAGGGFALFGLVLMFTKDKIPGFVDRIFTTVIRKFGGNGGHTKKE